MTQSTTDTKVVSLLAILKRAREEAICTKVELDGLRAATDVAT